MFWKLRQICEAPEGAEPSGGADPQGWALPEILSALAMSDPDTLTELINLFVADTADRLRDLRAAADRRDYASLREVAHTLKGSAGQMGAEQIAELCRDIERCAGRRESLDYPALVSLLDRYFQGVRQDMLAGRNCIA